MDIGHILLTGITFFIVLSILVLVHEFGHFLAAKVVGVTVEEFGIGLPPRIWGRKYRDVLYSVNWLPIGGFVKLAGEDVSDKEMEEIKKNNPDGVNKFFWARSKKERAFILLAGVSMNFILAVILTAFLLTRGVPTPTDRTHVEFVLPGSPAQSAGILKGDIIFSIQYTLDGKPETKTISTPVDLIETTKSHLGEEILLTIDRNGKTIVLAITPRKVYPKGEGPMGVSISNLEKHAVPLLSAPGYALRINLERSGLMFTSILRPLRKLLTFQSVCGEVSGPIGIARFTGQAVQIGFDAVVELMSLISLNLALLNVLPIPALDGGRLAFVLLEKLARRRVKPALENSAHQFGFIILLSLILLVSINDIFCPLPIQ